MLDKRRARRREDRPQRFKRGVYLLPSMFTVANLFCGYGCVVYATQQDFDTAAVLIGIAMILDTLDGFVARLTKSTSAFGVQLDSLADVVSQATALHRGSRLGDVLGICSVLVGDRPSSTEDPADVVVPPGSTVEFLPPFAGG